MLSNDTVGNPTSRVDIDNVEALDDSVDDVMGQSDRMVNLIVKKLLYS